MHRETNQWALKYRGFLHLQRSTLTEQQLKEEVMALEKQGHRRLLVLTGEHPKYPFDDFLKVTFPIDAVVRMCGNRHCSLRESSILYEIELPIYSLTMTKFTPPTPQFFLNDVRAMIVLPRP